MYNPVESWRVRRRRERDATAAEMCEICGVAARAFAVATLSNGWCSCCSSPSWTTPRAPPSYQTPPRIPSICLHLLVPQTHRPPGEALTSSTSSRESLPADLRLNYGQSEASQSLFVRSFLPSFRRDRSASSFRPSPSTRVELVGPASQTLPRPSTPRSPTLPTLSNSLSVPRSASG